MKIKNSLKSNFIIFIKKPKTICMLFILLATIFICIPLFNANVDMTYDDGIQHIYRLIGTEQSINEGQEFPVIMSEFCNGFGYSWNIFYSPLTAFLPLVFRIIGANYATCIKIFMFFAVFLSGITMFNFTKKITRNKKVATIAAILYILVPYRLTDMYVRNALAELTSFIFIPMVFNGIYTILNETHKKSYSLAIGTIGLILTHTVITMYTAIFAFIYLALHYKKLKKKQVWKKLIINLLFAVLITSFFWAPLLEHKASADYEVFKPGRMERVEVLKAFKLSPLQLFFTSGSQNMTYELGIVTVIGLILSIFIIKKLKKNNHLKTTFFKTYLFMLIAGIVSVIMTLNIFPFEYLPSTLKMLQFSFRMLEFAAFFLSFVVATNLGILAKKLKYSDITIVLLTMIINIGCLFGHVQYLESYDESLLTPAVSVTEETGRVHAGCASFEYLPCKAFENLDYIITRDDSVKVLQGSVQIENEYKENTNMTFDLKYSISTDTQIELPYIYYLGYSVKLETEDEVIELQTFETDNGFVGVEIPVVENAKITVSYEGTNIMKITKVISIISAIFFIIYIVFSKKILNSLLNNLEKHRRKLWKSLKNKQA